jgi:hypothetical protein
LRPPWLATVEAVPPHFAPVVARVPPRLSYPEDRLRAIFLRNNPDARRHPLNLKAASREEAHTADRFVAVQMRAMREQAMSEGDAYTYSERALKESDAARARQDTLISSVMEDPSEENQPARIYLASLAESKADMQLLEYLLKEQEPDERRQQQRSEEDVVAAAQR